MRIPAVRHSIKFEERRVFDLDCFLRAVVDAGLAVETPDAFLPDRFFIRHHDIVDRTDFLTNAAAGAFFSNAEAGIVEMNELVPAQVGG